MDIPVILLGLSLTILLAYFGLRFVMAWRRPQFSTLGAIRSAAVSARASTDQPVLHGLFSEVNTLRLQVETLRAELTTLTTGSRSDRARLRPYRSGHYASLPRPLRRQVREMRSIRHPVAV